jgi:hypothetical protein
MNDEHQEDAERVEAEVDAKPAEAQDAPRAISPDEAQQLVAKAYLRGRQEAKPATPPAAAAQSSAPPARANQGSVVAFVAIAVVVLVVIVGFVVLMWRLSKSETGLKTYILEHL